MGLDAPQLRLAGDADLPGIVAVTAAGFAGYRAFAPPGWAPPDDHAERMAKALADPTGWTAVAVHEGAVVGVAGWMAAAEGRGGPPSAGIGHVWSLFVAEAWWGTGLAASLLERAVGAMRAGGFRRARLYTPAGQARARAFYRREGWTEVGAPFAHPDVSLDLVELRRAL
jgi:GNAT superfamily N-acetyltransferase